VNTSSYYRGGEGRGKRERTQYAQEKGGRGNSKGRERGVHLGVLVKKSRDVVGNC